MIQFYVENITQFVMSSQAEKTPVDQVGSQDTLEIRPVYSH